MAVSPVMQARAYPTKSNLKDVKEGVAVEAGLSPIRASVMKNDAQERGVDVDGAVVLDEP